MNLWNLYVHFNSTRCVLHTTGWLLWLLHHQLGMNSGYLNLGVSSDTPATEQEVFLKTTAHSNLNGESEASAKQSSPSVYLLKFKIEISLGRTIFVLKGWIAAGTTDPQPCLMPPGSVVM